MNLSTLPHEYHVEIDHVRKIEWENLLPQFDDATIYQTWSYGAVRWGEKNLSHLVIKKNNHTVGLAQLTIMEVPIIKAGIAYMPWGPLWQKKESLRNIEDFRSIIKAIKNEYAVRRGLYLRIAPHIVEDDDSTVLCQILENEGFKRNLSISRTFLVDLSPSLPEIRKKLDQKWRNQLNRSERNGLKILEGTGDNLFQIFLNLQKQMHERKKYIPGVDYDEFREIQRELPEPLKMRIIVCEYEGVPVTAAVVSAIGNTGIYLLGATGDLGLQLKGAYLSQWLMIQWLQARGCRWYDLGGINPKNNPGVYHFKAGLSGMDVCHIGQYEFSKGGKDLFLVKIGELL
ncbi:MAG: peptidoglycan bridge formation glycyltransferase FemA/FemB family protein [Candidatus Omnitrophica bacterium]|nr:peptidoglycan bridge formation glycyltransferase FemA/FemB family protein [Candidatus Omnitrophota bacterium]